MKIELALAVRTATQNCDALTRLIGLAPDECREKGFTRRPGQTPSTETVWKLRSVTENAKSLTQSVDELVARLEPHADALERASREVRFDLDCAVWLVAKDETLSLGLSAGAVHFLARLNAELGIEVY